MLTRYFDEATAEWRKCLDSAQQDPLDEAAERLAAFEWYARELEEYAPVHVVNGLQSEVDLVSRRSDWRRAGGR